LRRYRTTVHTLFAAIAVLAALLPIAGPLLDHHYVERLASHNHIYLGEVNPDHTHPYEVAHSHDDAAHHDDPGTTRHTHQAEQQADTDIIYLPDDNASAGAGIASFLGFTLHRSLPLIENIRPGLPPEGNVPPAADPCLAVPHPPPQA
jgi:hypothetical protein